MASCHLTKGEPLAHHLYGWNVVSQVFGNQDGQECHWLSSPVAPAPSLGTVLSHWKPLSTWTFSPLTDTLPSRLCLPDSVALLLFPLQGFQSDPFYHLTAYLCLSLVVAQFVLFCLTDRPPFLPKDPQQSVSHHVSNSVPVLSLPPFWPRSSHVTEGR